MIQLEFCRSNFNARSLILLLSQISHIIILSFSVTILYFQSYSIGICLTSWIQPYRKLPSISIYICIDIVLMNKWLSLSYSSQCIEQYSVGLRLQFCFRDVYFYVLVVVIKGGYYMLLYILGIIEIVLFRLIG